jgi:hypothetical protein
VRLQSQVNRRVRAQPCWTRATLTTRPERICLAELRPKNLTPFFAPSQTLISSRHGLVKILLSLSDECFRLFCIQNTESELIEIHLFEADFRSPPAFEAVSYAWGEDQAFSTILCNGQYLSVSSNVEAILQRLRQQASVGTFWIDSICINQASISERNIQVPRMRSIYSEARLVWIWLGEGTDEIKIAFRFLLEITDIFEEALSLEDVYRHVSTHEKFKSESTSKAIITTLNILTTLR